MNDKQQNPFESPQADDAIEKKGDGDIAVNGLFIQLSIVSWCMAMGMLQAYGLSFNDMDLWRHYRGTPSDFAIQNGVISDLGISHIINLFKPKASLTPIFSVRFLQVIIRSLRFSIPIWLFFGVGIGLGIEEFRSSIPGEHQWYQISAMLLAAGFTIFVWGRYWHQNKNTWW